MVERKQKGGFVKGWFWRMCHRSGFFWGVRRSVCSTLVPVFGVQEKLAKATLLETTLLRTPKMGLFALSLAVCDFKSCDFDRAPPDYVYPDVCLGIAHVSGKAPLSGQGKRADTQCTCPFCTKESVGQKGQIHCVSALFPCPERGALPDTWQSLNTHRGKHRSGGARPAAKGASQNGVRQKSDQNRPKKVTKRLPKR